MERHGAHEDGRVSEGSVKSNHCIGTLRSMDSAHDDEMMVSY